jgi:hypothetical protein
MLKIFHEIFGSGIDSLRLAAREPIKPTKKARDFLNNKYSLRPLKNVQFCSRSRKAKILTTGIHFSIPRIKI